jgi:B9 domain-containing protein 2
MSSKTAEVHFIGEVICGQNFQGDSFFVTFEFVCGTQWTHIDGNAVGTSHVMQNAHNGVVWSLPVDVHFAANSVQGWPRIAVQVWHVDGYGRKDLAGYGTVFAPMPLGVRGDGFLSIDGVASAQNAQAPTLSFSAGSAAIGASSMGRSVARGGPGAGLGSTCAPPLTVETWKPTFWHSSPIVRWYQQLRQAVMGGNPVLRDDTLVHTNDNRYKLHTMGGGQVLISLTCIMRNAGALGLAFS